MISDRGRLLKPSPTLAMANRARELASAGKPVISLTVGEPDWPTLEAAREAGREALEKNFTKYTPAHGIPELRKALGPWIQEETGQTYNENEIVVGTGAKFVIAAALQMTVNPGDEVLIPAPYWVSSPVMAELAGGVPKIIATRAEDRFQLSAESLEAAITSRSKVLILCSPSNPTGLAASSQELQAIAEIVRRHPQLLIISDDIYNRLMLNSAQPAPQILKVAPDLRDRVLVVNGASKAFSMTGWRIGWAAGPQSLMKVMADYMSQTTSNPCSISQKAALGAILRGREELELRRKDLALRCASGLEVLGTLKGVEAVKPDGAFYFWMKVDGLFQRTHRGSGRKLTNSKDVAELLLDQAFVATVPGVEFGQEGYLRASFATKVEDFQEAVRRWSALISELSN